MIVGSFPNYSETYILNQITGLIEKGHDVKVIASCKPKGQLHGDYYKYNLGRITKYHNMPRNYLLGIIILCIKIIKRLKKNKMLLLKSYKILKDYTSLHITLSAFYYLLELLDNDYDIIHAQMGERGRIAAVLKEVGLKGKLIVSFHGGDINIGTKRLRQIVYNKLFKIMKIAIVNSNFGEKKLKGLGCPKNKIRILPVGLRTSLLNPTNKNNLFKPTVIILTIARLIECKGLKYAIEAFYEVVKRHPTTKYIIAGEGEDRKKIENLIRSLELSGCVKMLGSVTQEEAYFLYRISDIFILPSVKGSDGATETQGLVLQEAQSAGIPVITTDIGGIPDGLIPNVTGFIGPERNKRYLIEKINYLINNPNARYRMGMAGIDFTKTKYDIQDLNSKLIRIYTETINPTSSL